MPGIIYCIRNTVNGKVYVGQTRNEFSRRYSGGKWWKYTSNEHLRRSALLYGVDAFEVSILQECQSDDELTKCELDWIDKLDAARSGYNIISSAREYLPGSNSPRGRLPDEVREKIRATLLEVWSTNDNSVKDRHAEALSAWWSEKTEEDKATILEKRAQTKSSSEWRQYLSDQIKAGHALRTVESKSVQYEKQRATNAAKSSEEKAVDYARRAEKRKAYWAAMTPEERETKLAAKNAKIKAALLSRAKNDDYAPRVAKRKNKPIEEIELSEVKRLLDRFGPIWRPSGRSSWANKIERFEELRKKLIGKPTVVVIAGQCGVGKTWTCENSGIPFVSYDQCKLNSYDAIASTLRSKQVVLFDVPIRSKVHVKNLSKLYNVEYVVILEHVDTVRERLVNRGSTRLSNVDKMYAKYTRYAKAASFSGSSDSVLQYLVSKYGVQRE